MNYYVVSALGILISVSIYYYELISFESEFFSAIIDVTPDLNLIFKNLDTDSDGLLNLSEFSGLENSYTIIQKNIHDSESNYEVQQFPSLTAQFGEQIINIEVNFQPLRLSSLRKSIADIPKENMGTLEGLLAWTKPFKERHPFSARSFSLFLPKTSNVHPGYLWWVVKPKLDKYSAPLSSRRLFPPKVEEDFLVLHSLLSLFHPQPFLQTRFAPQGTIAIIKAVGDNFYDIIFRTHAEFQLNKPPLHPFWFTPSQFCGRLIINKDGTLVKFFDMKVPNTKINVDMEWLNGPTEESMEVDIGYIPEMSLVSSAISVPPTNKKRSDQKLSSIQWIAEISLEEAYDAVELEFFPFKNVKYHDFRKVFRIASNESKLVHGIVLWGNLADQSC